MTSARVSAVVALATLLLAPSAFGQIPSPTGNLYGTVLDAEVRPMPGVEVTLTGPGATQTLSTDRKGDFHFLSLSPGAYAVTLERNGFETTRRAVTVAIGSNSVLTSVGDCYDNAVAESFFATLECEWLGQLSPINYERRMQVAV